MLCRPSPRFTFFFSTTMLFIYTAVIAFLGILVSPDFRPFFDPKLGFFSRYGIFLRGPQSPNALYFDCVRNLPSSQPSRMPFFFRCRGGFRKILAPPPSVDCRRFLTLYISRTPTIVPKPVFSSNQNFCDRFQETRKPRTLFSTKTSTRQTSHYCSYTKCQTSPQSYPNT